MFNVSGVFSYCKTEMKDGRTVQKGMGEPRGKDVSERRKSEFDIMHYNDVSLVKWPQLFRLLRQHIIFPIMAFNAFILNNTQVERQRRREREISSCYCPFWQMRLPGCNFG